MSQFYIYCADVYCEKCGEDICKRHLACIDEDQAKDYHDETLYDSDEFPKGPYDNDSEETDCPQHCGSHADCLDPTIIDGEKYGQFLPQSLTTDGENYVREAIAEGGVVAEFWRDEFTKMGHDLTQ